MNASPILVDYFHGFKFYFSNLYGVHINSILIAMIQQTVNLITTSWLVGPVPMVLGVPCMVVHSAHTSEVFHFLFEPLEC